MLFEGGGGGGRRRELERGDLSGRTFPEWIRRRVFEDRFGGR